MRGVKNPNGPINYTARYARRYLRISKLKRDIGCQHCGYNEHACALDFDHIDQATKEFLIPRCLARTPLKRLFNEIRKCQILCANCHRVHSDKQRKMNVAV